MVFFLFLAVRIIDVDNDRDGWGVYVIDANQLEIILLNEANMIGLTEYSDQDLFEYYYPRIAATWPSTHTHTHTFYEEFQRKKYFSR
jgi:hypothetical protein